MTAVEALGQSQDRRQVANRPAAPASEPAVIIVPLAGLRTAMISGDEGNCFDLIRLESPQVSILNQVIGVLVMPFVRDVHADVVQQGSILQPLPLAIGQPMEASGLLEERK